MLSCCTNLLNAAREAGYRIYAVLVQGGGLKEVKYADKAVYLPWRPRRAPSQHRLLLCYVCCFVVSARRLCEVGVTVACLRRVYVANRKYILIAAALQALLGAWGLLLTVTAGTQPLIASAPCCLILHGVSYSVPTRLINPILAVSTRRHGGLRDERLQAEPDLPAANEPRAQLQQESECATDGCHTHPSQLHMLWDQIRDTVLVRD